MNTPITPQRIFAPQTVDISHVQDNHYYPVRTNWSSVELGLLCVWITVDAVVLFIQPDNTWWISFQIVTLGLLTNFYNFVLPMLVAFVSGTRPYMPLRRTILLNVGIVVSFSGFMVAEYNRWIPSSSENQNLSSTVRPSLVGWISSMAFTDWIALLATALSVLGLAIVSVAMWWLVVFAKKQRLSVPQGQMRFAGAILSMEVAAYLFAIITFVSAIDGILSVFSISLGTSRTEVFLLAFGCSLIPAIALILNFTPAVLSGEPDPSYEQISKKWINILGFAVSLFALVRLTYSIAGSDVIEESMALSFLAIPAVFIALIISRLLIPIITSLNIKTSLTSGYIAWMASLLFFVSVWAWAYTVVYEMPNADFYLFSFFLFGVKIMITAYILFVVENHRKVAIMKNPALPITQSIFYLIGLSITALYTYDIFPIPLIGRMFTLILITLTVFGPVVLGYPKRLPGEPSCRQHTNKVLSSKYYDPKGYKEGTQTFSITRLRFFR